jgi:hypothetical protein
LHALDAYRELLKKPSALSEDQFKAYISLVGETIDSLLRSEKGARISEKFRQDYSDLNELRAVRMKDWEAVGFLGNEVAPELARRLSQARAYSPDPFRFTRNSGGKDILLLAAWVPDSAQEETVGVFGVQVEEGRLIKTVLPEALKNAQLNEGTEAVLTDLAGRPLSQKISPATALPLATEYFEDNFPPWRIEAFRVSEKGLGGFDLRRNYFFWTILTMIIVLVFGGFLTARTIAHEMEILKIKSDFVASVSHEFKTPLTSTRALMERGRSGTRRKWTSTSRSSPRIRTS